MRLELRPTPSMRTSEPGSAAAAAAGKAADDMSPGHAGVEAAQALAAVEGHARPV